ncbi:MoaD/ThiS family protein [Candidatus Poribacteria bacterium]|nr:MoaD/ThiS family protein [Candidatus Poribacteria bacterium]MYA98126.1 MoaD/ThiS family protein [Candidatus Poribacteria bacterium]
MPIVAIPSLLRNLTNGEDSVTVPGTTIREVINNLETHYPGMKARLCEDDRIKPGIAVYVNGLLTRGSILESVDADAEIHFLPAIGGGISETVH